jgi:DNA transformation protein and related proteins
MGELCKLTNIGDKLEAQLNEVGIETFDQLKKVGSKQAWLNIKAIDNSACINRLCALEGAIQGVRWHSLSNEVKDELKVFFNTVK